MGKLLTIVIVFGAGLASGYYLWGLNGIAELQHTFANAPSIPSIVEKATKSVSGSEKSSTKSLTADEISSGIIGIWRSDDDRRFTREFSVDATVTDRYQNDDSATVEGQWAVFTSPSGERPPFTIEKGVTYLKISSLEEMLYYKVVALTDDELELTYLDGSGGDMRFSRVR